MRNVCHRLILRFTGRWLVATLLIGLAMVGRSVPVAAAPTGAESWTTRSTTQAQFHFDPALPQQPDLAPDFFVATYGEPIDDAVTQLALVFGIPAPAIDVWITASDPATTAPEPVRVDPADGSLVIDGAALIARTDIESINLLRSAIARRLLGDAGGGLVAPAFVEGMALYARLPLTPAISRHAALLQNANSQGQLMSWADLNRAASGETLATDLSVAEQYAVTAYLIDHYGIAAYQAFLRASAEQPTWREALQAAYGVAANDIEQQWRQDLSRWTNSGWKTNVIAGFDLDPARALLERGNYSAAKAELERSQRLFSELGDEQSLQTVSTLMSQCDVGLQAEALMARTEEALQQFDYASAADLLAQAEEQYARMPPDQRPVDILQQYRALTNQGMTAIDQLANADRLAGSWTEFSLARDDAIAAGRTFATLGDADRLKQTSAVLDRIDGRQRRLVLLLGGLALISLAWLLLWRRNGVNQTMRWPDRLASSPSSAQGE